MGRFSVYTIEERDAIAEDYIRNVDVTMMEVAMEHDISFPQLSNWIASYKQRHQDWRKLRSTQNESL